MLAIEYSCKSVLWWGGVGCSLYSLLCSSVQAFPFHNIMDVPHTAHLEQDLVTMCYITFLQWPQGIFHQDTLKPNGGWKGWPWEFDSIIVFTYVSDSRSHSIGESANVLGVLTWLGNKNLCSVILDYSLNVPGLLVSCLELALEVTVLMLCRTLGHRSHRILHRGHPLTPQESHYSGMV